ncbi:hypothetical protein FRE64_07470 [Euhalothece natronophila Z-M001]|uniref:Uncharacterized protein n=1 Tax=Euhalothece natronophila Z-M001 TaxID=522448 RepID=A0A5B8NNG8_9CHRO|nr:hypothetical protein [Euhalothece natronophila]QDZ39795.1 hypothetical protein FRE64_07470 [Euhalothece natronophila Z-M001]
MSTLHSTTIRRLLNLPQDDSVWEGDRRSLEGLISDQEEEKSSQECVIWVDGSEGMVRGMEMVSQDTGMEVMVRTLLRAMEAPQSYGKPCRPKSIIVRDREILFFLRGILQEVGIKIDYAPELPLIDTLFQGLTESQEERPPLLPESYKKALVKTAGEIWENAPWDFLDDSEVITIEFPHWDIDPLYLSIMGMLGQEYGVLLYRSLASMKTFRSEVLNIEDMEKLENAFLKQDCWFLNYEIPEDVEEEEAESLSAAEVDPYFGSISPYEGIRPFLGEEEAAIVYVALQGLKRFVQSSESELDTTEKLEKHYHIPLPTTSHDSSNIHVKLSTNPELEEELMMLWDDDEEDEEPLPLINDDLVPKDSFLSLGMVPWDMIHQMQNNPKQLYESLGATEKGEGMPVILIQTSRPKAQTMIEQIQDSGGLEGIGFNEGEDSSVNTIYDLGLLQMGDGELYLFGEFNKDDPTHVKARQHWDRRCEQTGGYCALILARGLKGANRGKPQLRDMMALFEAKALSPEDLGLGVLSAIDL